MFIEDFAANGLVKIGFDMQLKPPYEQDGWTPFEETD